MTSVFDVAKYILEQKGPMSTWKLQKLCYYSQAWSLAWGDGALFPEEFQAWSNGPVCRPLFLQHQGRYRIGAGDLSVGDSSVLSDLQKEDIDIILRDYGDKEAYWLREQTHQEAPWIEARNGLPDGVSSSAIITQDAMGAYYGSL